MFTAVVGYSSQNAKLSPGPVLLQSQQKSQFLIANHIQSESANLWSKMYWTDSHVHEYSPRPAPHGTWLKKSGLRSLGSSATGNYVILDDSDQV